MLERDDEPDLLLVALRVLLELAARVDVEALDERVAVRPVDAAAQVGEVLDRLAAGQAVVERELARDVADPAVDRRPGRRSSRCRTRTRVPDVGRMRSRRVRIVVVLPAPLGPRKPKTSPAWTSRSTSMMPRCSPYDFVSRSVRMMAGMSSPFPRGRRRASPRGGALNWSTGDRSRRSTMHRVRARGRHGAAGARRGVGGRPGRRCADPERVEDGPQSSRWRFSISADRARRSRSSSRGGRPVAGCGGSKPEGSSQRAAPLIAPRLAPMALRDVVDASARAARRRGARPSIRPATGGRPSEARMRDQRSTNAAFRRLHAGMLRPFRIFSQY